MPPLTTREEAHRLGEIGDRAGTEALVGRARRARAERSVDATAIRAPVGAQRSTRAQDGEHDQAARTGAADDGHGGSRR